MELRRIHSRRNRCDRSKRFVSVRHEAISIRNDEIAFTILSRRQLDCGNRNVDAVCLSALFSPEGVELMTVAASDVEERASTRREKVSDRIDEKGGESALEKPAPRERCFSRVARLAGAAILRLQ